jgi:4-hydroxythreonine-4-phosphate dehydrogenase
MSAEPSATRPPLVAVTMGDPAGIGPEIVVKALKAGECHTVCRPLVVGGREIMEEACRRYGPLRVRATRLGELPLQFEPGVLYLLDAFGADLKTLLPGSHSRATGRAAGAAVRLAAKLAHEGKVDAIATAPISKEAFYDLGLGFAGHTEFLASICAAKRSLPMFISPRTRVTLATTHLPLTKVSRTLTKARILDAILLTHIGMRTFFARRRPRIAVCGLNPHCGEWGRMGKEEMKVILPAIEAAQERGVDAHGPYAADAVFERAMGGEEFDAIVAMYHDQGLAPLRVLGRGRVVNLSLGIPFVRTSVEHGTAPDIAWRGLASPESMTRAVVTAGKLAQRVGDTPLDWSTKNLK